MRPLTKEDRRETHAFCCGPLRSSWNGHLLRSGAGRAVRSRRAPTHMRTTRKRVKRNSRSPLRPARTAARKTSRFPAPSTPGPSTRRPGSTDRKFRPPAGAKLWNPVKVKLQAGRQGDRRHRVQRDRPAHLLRDGQCRLRLHLDRDAAQRPRLVAAARMWRTCPHAKAVPGARIAYADEREIQRATDAGALVIVVPTVDTVQEASNARDWTYFPPLGKRSQGGGQGFDAAMWGGVPGGYRADDQRQHRPDPDDRDDRRREERARDREDPGRRRAVRGERRPRQLLGLTRRARPTTSA